MKLKTVHAISYSLLISALGYGFVDKFIFRSEKKAEQVETTIAKIPMAKPAVVTTVAAASSKVSIAEIPDEKSIDTEVDQNSEEESKKTFSDILDSISDSDTPKPRTENRDERKENIVTALINDESITKLGIIESVKCDAKNCTAVINSNADVWELTEAFISFAKHNRETGETLTLMTNNPQRPISISTSFGVNK